MLRKLFGMGAVVVLATTAVAVATPGVSGAAAPAAVGSVTCAVTGVGKFSPKLTLPGTVGVTAEKYSFKEVSPTSGGCSGSASVSNSAGSLTPVTILGVKIKGTGFLIPPSGLANACSVFNLADSIGSLTVKYTWSASPPIAPTIVTYTGGTAPVVSGSPLDTITLPATGTAVSGTGSFGASFASNIMLTNIPSVCAAGWGPFPSHTIGVGSSISLP
ncbi:MAG TPA: hypothetical protein VII96_10010 [Acidimicrobiales bacterium]